MLDSFIRSTIGCDNRCWHCLSADAFNADYRETIPTEVQQRRGGDEAALFGTSEFKDTAAFEAQVTTIKMHCPSESETARKFTTWSWMCAQSP